MNNVFSGLIIVVALFGLMKSCSGPAHTNQTTQVNQTQVQVIQRTQAAEGMDLKAIGALASKVPNVEAFEKALNHPDSLFNNLDLNEDGKVDYVQVREYGETNPKGLALYTELAPGDIQEIAEIEFSKSDSNVTVGVAGNRQIYGSGAYHSYHYGPSFFDIMLIGWMFSPHSMWSSPYGYGRYPGYYGGGYNRHNSSKFRNHNRNYGAAGASYTRPSQSPNKLSSPVKGKSSNLVKANLKSPTQSQKSFQKRQSTQVRSGGFGKSRSSGSMRGFGRSGGFRGGK